MHNVFSPICPIRGDFFLNLKSIFMKPTNRAVHGGVCEDMVCVLVEDEFYH